MNMHELWKVLWTYDAIFLPRPECSSVLFKADPIFHLHPLFSLSIWFKTLQCLPITQKVKFKLLTMAYKVCPHLQLHPLWPAPHFVHQPHWLRAPRSPHLSQDLCTFCSLCLECFSLPLLFPIPSTHTLYFFSFFVTQLKFSQGRFPEALEQPHPIELSAMMKALQSAPFNRVISSHMWLSGTWSV